MVAWLFLISLLLLVLQARENFTDTEFTNVVRPDASKQGDVGGWKSKILSAAPRGYDETEYLTAITAFYDKVYVSAQVKPTAADVDAFLLSSSVPASVDKPSLKAILIDGFHVEGTGDKEKGQLNTSADPRVHLELLGDSLAPGNNDIEWVDEVNTRAQDSYTSSDPVAGMTSEGNYAPVTQQLKPRRPGDGAYTAPFNKMPYNL